VVGTGVCAKWVLRGRFYALSSAGKMEDWTGLYISLSLRRIFYFFTIYGFAFRGQTSLDVVPWVASRRGQMNIFYAPSDLFYSPFLLLFFFFSSFLFYEMLDVLFYGLICREERFDGDGENGVFFFVRLMRFFPFA
jgi:hypothetical protein